MPHVPGLIRVGHKGADHVAPGNTAASFEAALDHGVDMIEFDERRVLRRIREDDPTRGIGDALLDQRNVAGIGNAWKAEACFATGIDPWRSVSEVSDGEAHALARAARALMQVSVERGGGKHRIAVFERAGRPCPRCGALIQARGQGDDNRTTYWCPGCQR